MALLDKSNERKKEERFVGVILSPQVYHYLMLYRIAMDTDTSKVVRQRMEEWLIEQQQSESEKVLVQRIVKKLSTEWLLKKSGYTVITFSSFLQEVEYELMDKKIPEAYIKIILEELERNESNKKTRIP